MSGAFSYTPIQVPDFGQTLARAQGLQANRLAMLAQQRQLQQGQAMDEFLANNAGGFAAEDPSKRMNVLAQLATMGPQGLQIALPQIADLRAQMDWNNPSAGAPSPQAAPSAPSPGGPPLPAGAGAGGYYGTLRRQESGTDDAARNPRSTATGRYQFIDGTWLTFAQENPDLFRGMSREQILAARVNPQLQEQAARWYAQRNAATLQGAGLPVNDATIALSHALGAGGATAVLRADPNTPLAQVLGERVMQANPTWRGMTAGQFSQMMQRRYGAGSTFAGGDAAPAGDPNVTPVQMQQGGAPAAPGAVPSRGAGQGLPEVPGFDMARVQRALTMPNNQYARQYLQAYMQAAQLMQRGEPSAPVEIADPSSPTGRRLVQRQEAYGAPAPAPERNMQTVDLGEGAPEGPGRYAVEQTPEGPRLRRLGAQPPPSTQTQVNTGERRTDTLVANAWETYENTVVDAGRRERLFQRAEQAMATFNPGQLADRRLWLGGLASQLGLRVEGQSEGEVLRAVQRQLELAATPRGQGAITENERALIRETIPVLLSTPQGAREAMNLLRRLDAYDVRIAQIYRENARRNGGQPNPVSVREEIAAFVQANPMPDATAELGGFINRTGDQPPPGGAQPPPAATAPRPAPQPGTVEGGFRFRGGNPADRNNWERAQ